MTVLTLATLVLFIVLVGLALVQRGGMLESLARLGGGGARLILVVLSLLLVGAVAHRSFWYMDEEREAWITQGVVKADTISLGFNTKSRFRSLSQPLGRVLDRNGVVLAGYELRDGHLQRTYPEGPATAHVVGYWTGPLRDGVGVEKALTLVNDSLKDDRPHDLRLSLDVRLQRDAMRALDGNAGAIVVMDASNGEVLAAADLPSYDPNRITNDTVWRKLVLDERNRPLISRALRDNFSPGSSIKPFIALAAMLQNSPLPEQRGFFCDGAYEPGRGIKPISDHGSAHGGVDIFSAMRVSCNVYFSYLAYELVGYESAKSVLDSLGFNGRQLWNTGAFLNEPSTLPLVRSWVRARDEIAKTRLGIGQASVKANAVHIATLMAGVASGGLFLRPTLERGREVDTLPYSLDARTVQWLQELMDQPLLPGGTAYGAFASMARRGIAVAGKTGTADPEPDGREPSWFISYASKNGRRYAVVVAIQNRRGKYAGDLNAPMARALIESLDNYGYFAPIGGRPAPAREPQPRPMRPTRPQTQEQPAVIDTIRLEPEPEPPPTAEPPSAQPRDPQPEPEPVDSGR